MSPSPAPTRNPHFATRRAAGWETKKRARHEECGLCADSDESDDEEERPKAAFDLGSVTRRINFGGPFDVEAYEYVDDYDAHEEELKDLDKLETVNDDDDESSCLVPKKQKLGRAPDAVSENDLAIQGALFGDRVGIFDTVTGRVFGRPIALPAALPTLRRACREAKANGVSDPSLILLDGKGYRVGGTLLHQHAVRLCVHRKRCKVGGCSVLGCGYDVSFSRLKSIVRSEEAAEYARVYNVERNGRSAPKFSLPLSLVSLSSSPLRPSPPFPPSPHSIVSFTSRFP